MSYHLGKIICGLLMHLKMMNKKAVAACSSHPHDALLFLRWIFSPRICSSLISRSFENCTRHRELLFPSPTFSFAFSTVWTRIIKRSIFIALLCTSNVILSEKRKEKTLKVILRCNALNKLSSPDFYVSLLYFNDSTLHKNNIQEFDQ